MGNHVSTESPRKQFIASGRRMRDSLRSARDIVRRQRKADIYNTIYAELDEYIEQAIDSLLVMANVVDKLFRPGTGELEPASTADQNDLHELQNSLAAAKAERDELVDSLQTTQEQLEKYAADLSTLYRKEREKRAELVEAYRQLQDADRLKANFLSTINHELTSPLVPIDLSLQLLEKSDLGGEERQTLHSIKDKLTEYKRQLDGVIKYADLVNQTHVVSPQWIDVYPLVQANLQPLYRLAEARRITISVDDDMQNIKAYADPDLLGNLVYQLAHNAVKFNSPGGMVRIDAKPEGKSILFRFMDDGPGIQQRILEHFGEDFNQTVDALKRGTEGLGLGLALANYVAGVHNGVLKAQNGVERGTMVQLWLPVEDEK
jgi:signal transduction histidine kinase